VKIAMLDSKIGLLEALPIFNGLSRKQLGSIVDVTSKAFFYAGDHLITKNSPGDTAFLIMTGAARCLQFPGIPVSAEHIGPGALLGEMAMLVDTVYALTIQATGRVRALVFHREALKRAMQQEPAIAQQIAENLLARLQSLAQDLRRFDGLLARVENHQASNPATLLAEERSSRLISSFSYFPGLAEEKVRKFG
jgi:CRP/FNR family transcriptional regulator, cyclic AMP receptor protein